MLQESLIPFVKLARKEDDLTHIRIYDEGAGVSGTKGFDKRKKLRTLLEDIVSNYIGDVVLARPDRLFRDKHFQNVSTFTSLAEKMGIKVIVPTDRGIIKYDFTIYDDLQKFQKAMQEAYAYIENQIGYMNRARSYKMQRGFYGGGYMPLPYVLLRDMPKEEQVQVIYEPWKDAALDLFETFTKFNFESGRIARYVEEKPYLFKFMPEDHLIEYQPVTAMHRVNGGYTFTRIETLLHYLSNLSLAGYAHAGQDAKGNTILIPGAFEAAVPMELLEPCFAAITGEYLDGTPFIKHGAPRQYRRTDLEADAILHGLLTSDQGTISVYAQSEYNRPCYLCRKDGYFGQKARVGLGRIESAWALPSMSIDKIILDRLIALAEYDNGMVERIRTYFATISQEGQSALTVLDTAIHKTKIALKKLSRTIVFLIKQAAEIEAETESEIDEETEEAQLDPNDPLIVERKKLQATLRNLQKQRDTAAIQSKEDPSKSITDFYYVLSHLRAEFNKKDPQTKKDIMKKLIEEVKISAISPHLYTLHITWIKPLAAEREDGREDVALLWRSMPTKNDLTNIWTEEEEAALVSLYPNSPHRQVMQAIPNKTPGQIKNRAYQKGVKRDFYHIPREERFHWTVSYTDLEAAAAFTESEEERSLLWEEINTMAEQTKRGEVTANWFLPIDIVSFTNTHCVTNMIEAGLSGQAWSSMDKKTTNSTPIMVKMVSRRVKGNCSGV